MAPTLVYPALATFLLLISLPLSETRYVRHERSLISPRSGTWSYVGCYTDSVGARTLPSNPGTTGGTAALTVELCTSTCQGLGYVFAGMEYAGQCFCGNAFLNGGGPAPDGETGCDMACSGNATETCGGPNRLSLWDFNDAINATSSSSSSATASATSSSSSAAATGPPGWSELGCYTDSVGARALTDQLYTIPGASMTVEACTAACKTAGYPLAGVEYSDECYCGNTISNSNVLSTDGGCTMTCNGNTAEICGGPNRINIYSISGASSSGSATASGSASSVSASSSATATASTGWNSLGCYTDAVGARALVNQQYTIPGASMTVEACEAACKTLGYTLAGVEYSDECYCANSISNANAPATDGCTMTCNGNTAEICGGPNRINIYSYNSGATSSSASGTASATGSVTGTSTSVTASSTSPVATGLPSGWSYKGCWVDNQYGRILGYAQPNVASLTIESCIATCSGLGYSVAGMEYYTQCYCDNNIIQAGTLATSDSDCNTPCGGNSAEICGGGNLMSIYSNETTVDVIPLPTVQKTDLPGNWTYQGCLLDNAVTRTFPYQLEFLNNNTAENCLSQCQLFGYGAGGMEYGQQCFCGDVQNAIDAGATLQPEDTCNMLCSGNSSYYCGGPSRIQYYTWSGTPLESWDFKSGPEAGEYQFLIGGVIIPLISQPAINGKIAFLEKFGTEPANNSTGAYELDLASLDNFTAAWRPMHVQSDVFCSGGLTLPDKAGRLINIGGWANAATYGIRLYWPDGSPGVWGTNDWQENFEEVHLVDGRWYPTAMMMANGSILVMGGEEGSNGAPVPTLEVLPLPSGAGSIYCDYLDRTDPYNLYPYLTVLPSGGIFVAYYNEARILDETSLQTSRVLPNIPGAVNDFLGGRTYPFEGTAMLLPQYAPYHDPLTVMICGGSIPGPEFALDNCVSISPEVPNANWTIERMPSKRVISSIAALPDGTYIIMNGGQQGRAGFGLATEPNLNAVLYDPSKPLHNRMSSMSNTTIIRLYHSEAVLIPDGRVLVSGSDPEDLRFPQEYRVEVWVPPYLLTGNTQPTFTTSTKDIGYGDSWTVNVQLFQGTTDTMRVSLLAAVSSTHGNSMGQRTIFPAFSCGGASTGPTFSNGTAAAGNGTTCTIEAPPNANVSPPAWYLLFVLDGPTPSVGQWVRIGGDPGELGNWPNYPDFDIPGI